MTRKSFSSLCLVARQIRHKTKRCTVHAQLEILCKTVRKWTPNQRIANYFAHSFSRSSWFGNRSKFLSLKNNLSKTQLDQTKAHVWSLWQLWHMTSRYGLWPQQWHFAKTLPRLTASPCTSPWPALTPVTHLISPDSLKGIHALSWPSILYTQHRHRSGAKRGGPQILLVRLSPDQKVILHSGLALFSLGKTSQWLVFQKSSDLNKMLRLWYELVWFGLEPVTQAW